MSAGVVYEGEAPPEIEGVEAKALLVFRMLANGMGGLDWSGLELAVEKYEVDNVEDLIDRLIAIKTWKRPDDAGKD